MRRLRRMSVALFLFSLVLLGFHLFKVRIIDDRMGPVFHMENRKIEVSVKDGQEALLKGLTATDAKDGDVSGSIIVESIGPFTGTGSRIVNYAVFDSDNHVTHAKREMVYTDYEPSRFHLSRPLTFAMNTVNILNGISVEDSIDGDLTRNVRMMSDSEIDTAHVGEYSARLKVTNSAGGISYLPVTVEIYDASVFHGLPLIKLKEYVVYVEKGDEFDEREYLTSIVINGTSYSMTEEEGTYSAKHYEDDVPADVKQKRLDKLMRVQQNISAELEAEKVGSVMRVIIDRQEGDWYVGRTEFCSPEVDPEVLIPAEEKLTIGAFYDCRVTDSEEFDLYATTKI